MTIQNIAFVASNRNPDLFRSDPSFIYRCENLGLAMSEQGSDVQFFHLKRFTYKKQYQVVIFHRPLASVRLWYQLRQLRHRGVTVIADFDDLIFDESFTDYSPGVLNGLVSLRATRRRFQLHRRALSWFDAVTVSTLPLAEHLRRLFPNVAVEVIHNCVHQAWRDRSREFPDKSVKRIITYFPGTQSHSRDFSQIEKPLSDFLRAHPEIHLQITGPLVFSVDADPSQIVHDERVPFSEYQTQVERGWVNLAPLEETPFNNCKSALKVMEAGSFGIPTLCSSNPDNDRFVGTGAVMSKTPEAWFNNLEMLLDDVQYRRLSHVLRERMLVVADVNEQAESFSQFALSLK